jgi:hypothetical protein
VNKITNIATDGVLSIVEDLGINIGGLGNNKAA